MSPVHEIEAEADRAMRAGVAARMAAEVARQEAERRGPVAERAAA